MIKKNDDDTLFYQIIQNSFFSQFMSADGAISNWHVWQFFLMSMVVPGEKIH